MNYNTNKYTTLHNIEVFHKIGLGNVDEVQYNLGIILHDDTYIELASYLDHKRIKEFMNRLDYSDHDEFNYIQDSTKTLVTILLDFSILDHAIEHFKSYYDDIICECFDEEFLMLLESAYKKWLAE